MQQATLQDEPWLTERDGRLVLNVPMRFRRRGGRKEIFVPPRRNRGESGSTLAYKPLAVAIARAHRWKELLDQGRFGSVNELAEAVGVDHGHVGRLLNLTLLAPDLIARILDGQEPSGLSLRQLTRIMPSRWDEQRRVAAAFSDAERAERATP